MYKTIKKGLISALTVAMTFACIGEQRTVTAAETGRSYLDRLNQLAQHELQSDTYVTREDFCTVVSKIFQSDYDMTVELPFKDVGQIKPDNLPYLAALYKSGILAGSEANGQLYMLPDERISRQDALTFLGRVLSKKSDSRLTFSDVNKIADYAYGYISWFTENKVVSGYPNNSFGPKNNITSNELAIIIIKALDYKALNTYTVTEYFGTGSRGMSDGNKSSASFLLPGGVFGAGNGNVIVADTYNNAIRRLSADKAETITGNIKDNDDNGFPKGYYINGTLKASYLNRPTSVVVNSDGVLYICDSVNNAIRYEKDGYLHTLCGTSEGYADGTADTARFHNPMAIAIDQNDMIYVADTLNNCIRRIGSQGDVMTIAGTPGKEGSTDGDVNSALFRAPSGIAVSPDGSVIYVADTGNHKIRKIENDKVTTIAGRFTGYDEDGYPIGGFKDGAANESLFKLPVGMTLADGVLIIADSGNNSIRAVTEAGYTVTAAGNGEPGDILGNALESTFNQPMCVCYQDGYLYIADTGNNKIKRMRVELKVFEMVGGYMR